VCLYSENPDFIAVDGAERRKTSEDVISRIVICQDLPAGQSLKDSEGLNAECLNLEGAVDSGCREWRAVTPLMDG
jgi:hypothetical protein